MRKLEELEELEKCPEIWLVHAFARHGRAFPCGDVEIFDKEEYGDGTHVHFYCDKEKAQQWFDDMPEQFQQRVLACKTVSYGVNHV